MKTNSCIAFTLAALTLIGPAAFAQTTTATATSTQTTSTQTAEQREKARLEAEAARKAAAERANVDQARRDIERALKQVEEAQKLAQKQAQMQAQREIAKVQDALKHAQRELELYGKGTTALDQARYEKALQAFAEAAAMKGSRADGALYWKAFAEYKQAAMQAALESLKEIQKNFPDSRWLEQALALELEVKGAMGKPVSPAATPDEELKLLALNGLLQTDADQALPMLEKMLNSQQSPQLKKRALFVLSQSKSPKSKGIVTAIAKGSSNPDLQLEALRYLGMFGGPEDKETLADIYAASKDRDVKRQILKAYLIGEDFEALAQVARSDVDRDMRTRAVQLLYISSRNKTGDALAGLYWVNGQSNEVRAEIVNGLFAQGEAKALVEIARKETDPALRKAIVERLSMMKSKDATDYLMELINK